MLPAGKSVTHWFAFHMFLSRASSRASRIALPNILFASKVFSQRVASMLACLQVEVTSANQSRPSSRPQMCIMRDRSCSLKPAVSCAKGVDPVAGVVVGGVAAECVAAVALPSRVHVGGPRTPSRNLGGRSPATSPLVIRSRAGGSCSSGEGGSGRRVR